VAKGYGRNADRLSAKWPYDPDSLFSSVIPLPVAQVLARAS
jgi:hypothetical protein